VAAAWVTSTTGHAGADGDKRPKKTVKFAKNATSSKQSGTSKGAGKGAKKGKESGGDKSKVAKSEDADSTHCFR
jgi:hypothetical protein